MTRAKASSRRCRIAALVAGVAALSLALPSLAHADGKKHGKRHGHHSSRYYHSDDRYYAPPPAYYYGGPPPCRGPKRVNVYNHYYPVPVPVAVPAVPVYPGAYPQDYDAYDSKPVVRIGVDWVIGF
jgi:hypothetical protein